LPCWLRGVRYSTLTHDKMQRSVKYTHLNGRRGLKEVVREVAATRQTSEKSKTQWHWWNSKLNYENLKKSFLANVALFPDAVAFKKPSIKVVGVAYAERGNNRNKVTWIWRKTRIGCGVSKTRLGRNTSPISTKCTNVIWQSTASLEFSCYLSNFECKWNTIKHWMRWCIK